MVYTAKFTKTEIKVMEAGLNAPSYKEAAARIGMAQPTFYSHIRTAKEKIKNAKRFLFQSRRYEKMLFGERKEWQE